ncbi:efflux transporter, RND family, MFP subunit [Isosphaera pallida ATCC 43644]|jgi:RND family efflux transporter MFP subunit|uniref:Efflux transporter, RND family, MFP subunit n=1 Tax=Isosphaera pallida (strain ATCC 43644 / DSM 9630 / IS1B) TaxID=575540 RepID=E8R0N3_ISOPI|nr:efflux RND transporter periplasmic adaptor subunit [Isosphaera pallida]ADV61218.1 efflux transporter, RND family, MFP subunit [Isosphaera pallida ATCC 43644]
MPISFGFRPRDGDAAESCERSLVGACLVGQLRCGLAVVALTTGLAGCSQSGSSAGVSESDIVETTVPKVEVIRAADHLWPLTARIQGSLVGDEQAQIGARVAGRVESVTVDLGSRVATGDILAVLDQNEFALKVRLAQARVAQTRAALGLSEGQTRDDLAVDQVPSVRQEKALLDEAKALYDRSVTLAARNAITPEEFRRFEAQYQVARARHAAAINQVEELLAQYEGALADFDLARQEQADSIVRAPFDGIVAERFVAPGIYLAEGRPVVTLVRVDPLRYRAGVPERLAMNVALGQEVRIFLEGRDTPLIAQVTRISPSLDVLSRSLTIEADLPNPEGAYRAGLFAEAEIVIDPQARAVVLPAQAVSDFAGVEKVWMVQDGQAVGRPIQTGRREGHLVEIVSGLQVGDLVLAKAREGRGGPVQAVIAPAESSAPAVAAEPPARPPVQPRSAGVIIN